MRPQLSKRDAHCSSADHDLGQERLTVLELLPEALHARDQALSEDALGRHVIVQGAFDQLYHVALPAFTNSGLRLSWRQSSRHPLTRRLHAMGHRYMSDSNTIDLRLTIET